MQAAKMTASDATLLHDRARTDPIWWIRNILGHDPWEKQIKIIESVRDNKETAVRSCHDVGKSFSAADVALWFLYNHHPSIVLTTAPTDRQVKKILWKEIRMGHQRARYPLGGDLLLQELKLADNWFAMGFTAPEYDPDRFQGFHEVYILVIVDEASGVSEEIFDGISGVLTSEHARLLLIGNPTNPLGRFAKAFKMPDTSKIVISAFDTPNFTRFGITEQDIIADTWQGKITGPLPRPYLVTPNWVAARYKEWGRDSPLYQAKVLANFPAASPDTLIPLHWIEAAVARTLPPGHPSVLGVDVARFGTDESTITHRQGSQVRILKVIPVCDTMQLTGEVANHLRMTRAILANIDAVGIGAGVYDRLREQELPAAELQSGAAARDTERFANARAEWWWGLRTRFEEDDIDIEDDAVLIAQLSDVKYRINSRGQIQIEAKEDIKKRTGMSPDRAEGVLYAFAEPFKQENYILVYDDDDYQISPI